MNLEPVSSTMTTEEMFALPDADEMDRELVDGQLLEEPRSKRTPDHTLVEANLSHLFKLWLREQPKPRGRVHSGDCTFRLRRHPDTTVGIDVAVISADLAARTPKGASFYDGLPVLAIEIVSPSDTYSGVATKVRQYLQAGVPWVWVVDPFFNVVYVHRPQKELALVDGTGELVAEPDLPGLRLPVSALFEE